MNSAEVDEKAKECATCCSICCSVILWSIIATYAICAHIVAFAGLSHTQRVDLDPLCPKGYWDSSISLLFIRFAVFCLAIVSIFCSKQLRGVCCFMGITALALVTIFSVAVSDSVETAQAISALNCSTALRAGRDSDPLLIVSGSMFIMLDWLLCLCVCCACGREARESEEVECVDESGEVDNVLRMQTGLS
jgi:uncharacterized membrane protein